MHDMLVARAHGGTGGYSAVATAPAPRPDWALFLDLDGTLLDLAPTPGAVIVPDGLPGMLRAASAALGGALAIVSGRALQDIDLLLAPLKLAAAAEHGCELRQPDGAVRDCDEHVPQAWLGALAEELGGNSGITLEYKPHCLAIHYRAAPRAEARVYAMARRLLAADARRFELLPAHRAIEIRPRIANKGRAVCAFMAMPPFRGRTPICVGDDITDEEGFAAAEQLGGLGLPVAAYFSGRPALVRQWLAGFRLLRNGVGAHADA
jgi:trehalose 6-phosphate phosphatase